MTEEKIRQVINIYRREFARQNIVAKDYDHNKEIPSELDCYGGTNALKHCAGMLDKMDGFIAEGRMDKVYRWLGFVQGVLWARGWFTLDTLKNHNKKD